MNPGPTPDQRVCRPVISAARCGVVRGLRLTTHDGSRTWGIANSRWMRSRRRATSVVARTRTRSRPSQQPASVSAKWRLRSRLPARASRRLAGQALDPGNHPRRYQPRPARLPPRRVHVRLRLPTRPPPWPAVLPTPRGRDRRRSSPLPALTANRPSNQRPNRIGEAKRIPGSRQIQARERRHFSSAASGPTKLRARGRPLRAVIWLLLVVGECSKQKWPGRARVGDKGAVRSRRRSGWP